MALKTFSCCGLFFVRLCEFKSHFVNIDSRFLYAVKKEIYPVPDRSNKEVTGEARDTYWMNNFDCKRPIPAKRRYSRGPSMTMGYTYSFTFSGCRHFVLSRLRYRPCRSTKNKTKGHGTYHLHENDFVVGLYPWNTDFITIAVPKRSEDFTECSLRQKDMRLFQVLEIEVLPRSGNHESGEEN